MNSSYALVFIFFLLVDCRKERFYYSINGIKKYLTISIPKGYKEKNITDEHGKKISTYTYSNGEAFYITDDKAGLMSNAITYKYKSSIYDIIVVSDSIDLSGKYDGKYWREIKKNKIIFGYYRIDSLSIKKIDAIINKVEFERKY